MRNSIFKTEKKEEIIRKKNQTGPEWDLLIEELRKTWGYENDMINFCLSEIDILKQLPSGEIISIDKERIEKDFCFSYVYCGVSDEEDRREADQMASMAENNVDYFMKRNLRGLNSLIADLENNRTVFYSVPKYYQSDKYRAFINPFEWDHEEVLKKGRSITNEERKIYLSAVKEEKEKFEKRLATYLKKYGLSKVRSWTYLCD